MSDENQGASRPRDQKSAATRVGAWRAFERFTMWVKARLWRALPQDTPPQISRTDIVRALEDLVEFGVGFKFQALAVILAKIRWPEFIASEWYKDLGVDAYAPAYRGDPPKALAASIDASIAKIRADVEKVRKHFSDAELLVFYTPKPVTNYRAQQWKEAIASEFPGITLEVVSQEDIVATLTLPEYQALCASHLGLKVPSAPAVESRFNRVQAACAEVAENWATHARQPGSLVVELGLVDSNLGEDDEGAPTDLATVAELLLRGRAVVLSAPGGGGKTTTLVQLAELLQAHGRLGILIDMPQWLDSDLGLADYICRGQAFRSRGISASDLARVAHVHHIDWLFDGWNEISDHRLPAAATRLREFERDFPGTGVLIASRPQALAPPLGLRARIQIQPLTAAQRREFLSQTLGELAEGLLERVRGSEVLDALTRVPLLLAEIAELYRAGREIPRSAFDVLRAMSLRIESGRQHEAALAGDPIHGHAAEYLSALALSATSMGSTLLSDEEARRCVSAVADRLVSDGQLAGRPHPAAIIERLCGHHCLSRTDEPNGPVRFQHERFQEYYAARALADQLADLAAAEDPEMRRTLQRDYLDRPVFGSAFEMVAEAVGARSDHLGSDDDRNRLGALLVRVALNVDPIFAASLARVAGEAVWAEVGAELEHLLRGWYEAGDEHLRRYSVAAMLATGSDCFLDILEPLLRSDDAQARFSTYRALGEFFPSTLGTDWIDKVLAWEEGRRLEFLQETSWLHGASDVPPTLLREDPSELVRGAALEILLRHDTAVVEELEEYVSDGVLDAALQEGARLTWYPVAWRTRVRERAMALLDAESDSGRRIGMVARLVRGGEEDLVAILKAELGSLSSNQVQAIADFQLGDSISVVQEHDPGWTDRWVSERIADGALRGQRWVDRVGAIRSDLRDRLLEAMLRSAADTPIPNGVDALLAKFADAEAGRRILETMVELDADPPDGQEGEEQRAARARKRHRLMQFAMSMASDPLAEAVLGLGSGEIELKDVRVALDVLGSIGDREAVGSLMSPDVRSRLRSLLLGWEPSVLEAADYTGSLKAHLGLAIGRFGAPKDLEVLERLVRADIERMRSGREARRRGERGPAAEGATMGWSSWYVRVITWLEGTDGVALLGGLLEEPEYARDAANGLVTGILGLTPIDLARLPFLEDDSQPMDRGGVDEELRARIEAAIASRVRQLLAAVSDDGDDGALNHQLKGLVAELATVNRGSFSRLILEAVAIPGEWDIWDRTVALERVVAAVGHLPSDLAEAAVDSVLERLVEIGLNNQQVRSLPVRLLAVLPYLDDPERGVARIRRFLEAYNVSPYELRPLLGALGSSQSEAGVDLLVELAAVVSQGGSHVAADWIRAVSANRTPRAREVLLSFVDPGAVGAPGIQPREFSTLLESELAEAAEDPTVFDRLIALCGAELGSDPRALLAGVLARVGTPEALGPALLLIGDDQQPRIPFSLLRGLEHLLVERRPLSESPNTYTLLPASRDEIRYRLLELWVADDGRKQAADELLKSIDEWRLDYGKPAAERRHPGIDMGVPWPPRPEGH